MVASPFVVNAGTLRRSPGSRRDESRRGPLAGLTVLGSRVPEDADVEVDVVMESMPGAVLVRGTVRAPWRGECRRCLDETSGTLAVEVRELFEERPDPEQTYPLTGDQLDLEPMARDAVLLELPLAPLCKEDCPGLCPDCGADRNSGDCGCLPEVTDPRWAALDALRDS